MEKKIVYFFITLFIILIIGFYTSKSYMNQYTRDLCLDYGGLRVKKSYNNHYLYFEYIINNDKKENFYEYLHTPVNKILDDIDIIECDYSSFCNTTITDYMDYNYVNKLSSDNIEVISNNSISPCGNTSKEFRIKYIYDREVTSMNAQKK